MRLAQVYSGMGLYHPDHMTGSHRLFVAVRCHVEDLESETYALLDTASQWCVLPPGIAIDLGIDLSPNDQPVVLSTRFGEFYGRLERYRFRFVADKGEGLELEATCFISPDWPGPMVIGWKGCLEWMRFALDPGEDAFYFGAL